MSKVFDLENLLNNNIFRYDKNKMTVQVKATLPDSNDPFLSPARPQVNAELLDALPKLNEQALCWQRVRALGAEPLDGKSRTDNRLSPDYYSFAGMLASGKAAFAIRCSGVPDGKTGFEIGTAAELSPEYARKLLRSAFGIAELVPAEKPEQDTQAYWQAKCLPVRTDEEKLDGFDKPTEPGRWVDEIAAAVNGTARRVCVEFHPVDESWVKERLEDSYQADNEMSRYLKPNKQTSANYSYNGGKSIVARFQNKEHDDNLILGYKSETANSGYAYSQSISLDIENRDHEIEMQQKQLRFMIRLLEQVKKGGWCIRITVTEDRNDATMPSVCGALSAALLRVGYSCDWESSVHKGFEPAYSAVLPSHLVPAVISVPTDSFIGFELRHRTELNLNPPVEDAEENAIRVGTLLWNGEDSKCRISIPRKEVNRHMFVCGKTGSGKTNTVCSLLSSLKNDGNGKDLHFLVIEPVKGEYHSLPGMKRYTMVTSDAASLQMNPFWFPEGSSLQYHIDSLKLIITSAFALSAAMPNILEQCLYRIYVNCGWDFVSGKNIYWNQLPHEDLYPTFRSLCDEVELYLNSSEFGNENRSNYKGALLSRLQSFTGGVKGVLLNTTKHIPFDEWDRTDVVIELDALADDADKAIVMGALLIQYFQYVKYHSEHKAKDGLKHLFVLEEAHHLFKEDRKSGIEDSAASSSHLVEMLNNLLAEARAYGEGFIIVDQSPSSVSPSVLKNTGVKIVHRVDFGDDIELLQKGLLLNEGDRMCASLKIGEALIRYGEMPDPAHVKIPLCDEKEKCVIQKSAYDISAQQNAYDRILSNTDLIKELKRDAKRFLYLFLVENYDNRVIYNAFAAFNQRIYQLVAYKCGGDSAKALSSDKYLIPLFDICISASAAEIFPGQYYLQRILRMMIIRMTNLISESNKGKITAAEWDILSDFRKCRIYPRINFYIRNNPNVTVGNMLSVLGAGIPELIVMPSFFGKESRLWDVPVKTQEWEKEFRKNISEQFIIPPSEIELEYLRKLVLIYLTEIAKRSRENASV